MLRAQVPGAVRVITGEAGCHLKILSVEVMFELRSEGEADIS